MANHDAPSSSPSPSSAFVEISSPVPFDAACDDVSLPSQPSIAPLSDHPDDSSNAPSLPFFAIFVLFLGYGFRAFGGPVASVNIMREEL